VRNMNGFKVSTRLSMDELNEFADYLVDFPNLERVYLFDFTPGYGGDFFITLASKCSRHFINSWIEWPRVVDRMTEFRETSLMPGNNIGGKLIGYDDENSYRLTIIRDLCSSKITNKTGRYLSLCTHSTGDHEINILDTVRDLFAPVPVTPVCLEISTDRSHNWTCYHNPEQNWLDSQAPFSKWLFWQDPENTILIDPIDALIAKDYDKLRSLAESIGEDLNNNFYEFVLQQYLQYKVNPYYDQIRLSN